MALAARHLTIRGRVQGVFYRKWTAQAALGLGLAGWVRNRMDGGVEAWIEGEPAALDAFVAQAWDGPPAADVTAIDAEDGTPLELRGFEQRATA